MKRITAVLAGGLLLAGLPTAANATTINLSTMSSDATPASQLDAIFDFAVGEFDGGNAGDELKLTVTNPSLGQGGDALFNINEVFWNGSTNVTGLTLLSATHSVAGDVFAAWDAVETGTMVDGFGIFDFGLTDGVGALNPNIIEPGENVEFIMDIAGIGPIDMTDFIVANAAGKTAAGKFVNGPDDPEAPGSEDSAFGAVPEPGTVALLAMGLMGLALGRSRR